MDETGVWDVDRLAAAELLAALHAVNHVEWANLIATAFARSRQQNVRWAARRVHDAAIKSLEHAAVEQFGHRDAIWNEGFRFAENRLSTQAPADLLGVTTVPSKSRGQVLRSLIRSTKNASLG